MSLPGSRFRALFATACAVVLLAGCGAGQHDPKSTTTVPLPAPTAGNQAVTEANFGYLWPLTVDHGTLECRNRDEVVFVAPDGKSYALNDQAEAAGVPKIDPLQAEGSQGAKISLGALLSTGLGLCEKG
jgi:uncharacterized protein DUF2511